MMLINGQPQHQLDAGDRGLLYGDGLFETLAVTEGRPQHWERHLRRLSAGCERLRIPLPDTALLEAEAARLCRDAQRAVLKLVLTRGAAGRGYRMPLEASPTRLLALYPWPDYPARYYTEGVEVRVCQTRLGLNPALAGIKHLNRLEQVLARAEWGDEVQEGLMLDTEGGVVEGTMSNVFLVAGGRLLTPVLTRAGVAGIMRERILEAAGGQGIDVEVRPLGLADCEAAEGLFLTNSLIGIWPVRRLAEKHFTIPPMARQLMEALGVTQG